MMFFPKILKLKVGLIYFILLLVVSVSSYKKNKTTPTINCIWKSQSYCILSLLYISQNQIHIIYNFDNFISFIDYHYFIWNISLEFYLISYKIKK